MIDRLLIDKQKSTIHQVSEYLNKNSLEVDFNPLTELIAALDTDDLAKTAKEFENLETAVEGLEDSLALKAKVLKLIRDKTKIQVRSEEEMKPAGRGRPPLSLEEEGRETERKN